MQDGRLHEIVVVLVIVLLAASAIGYLVLPSNMLAIVGIASTPQTEFLVRTLAAAFLAMIPSAWAARRPSASPVNAAVIVGLAIYMFASSAVDLYAYLNSIVGPASIPSIIFRVALGGILLWLGVRRPNAISNRSPSKQAPGE